MFLRKLELRNIRCFADACIDFGDPEAGSRKWTVLIGENGTGKSSVLKSVALLMAGSDALTELIGDPDAWIAHGEEEAELRLTIATAEDEERQLCLRFYRGEGLSRFIGRSQDDLKPLNDALEHAARNYPTFGYGSSRRLGEASLSSEGGGSFRQQRARSVASLFSRQAELNPLEAWAMQLDYRSDGADLDMVRAVLTDFLPEISFSRVDKSRSRLMFETPDGEVPLGELSDGYQNVAAWVGDLLYQISATFEDYRQPLNARGLLIIDEVDLHLHPIWQRRLLQFLDTRLPRMQLLVTTHSVITAQQAPAHSLFYCVRRGGKPVVEPFGTDPGKYLLHQLAATEAFGQLSDESLEVEHLKTEYRDLHHKSAKSGDELSRMADIADTLAERPSDPHALPVMTPKQLAIMEQFVETARRDEGEVGA